MGDMAISKNVTHRHTEPELPYCYGQDAVTLDCGWFCYRDTDRGRIASTPLFDNWYQLLKYVGQEGYTFSLKQDRTFVRRESEHAA